MDGFELLKQNTRASYLYFRSTLNANEQKAYDKMLEGFFDFSDKISIHGVNMDSIQTVFHKIKQDVPGLFFVENASFQYTPLTGAGSVLPKYRFDKAKANATLIALCTKCRDVLQKAYSMPDIEKEKAIHDYLCNNVVYDYAFAESSFECVGPLLFGKGVCEGISRAAKMLFDFAGVKSLVVHGESNQQQGITNSSSNLHAWNMVNINGEFYHLDITFDLTIQTFGVVRYDYFNLSDRGICVDHIIHSTALPACNRENSYYRTHGMFMQTQKDFRDYLVKCFKTKQKDIVFQVPIVSDVERVKKEIMDIVSKNAYKGFLFSSQYQLASNETQFVFHVHIQ